MLFRSFSALDSHLRFRLEQELRETLRRFGKTVILVSHNRDEVYRMSDQIAVIHDGKIEAMGSKKDLFRTPGTRNGAILTGCKNITPIQKLDERRVLALDWDMELELVQDVGNATYIGMRMHDIGSAGDKNVFRCQVVEEIENPFSFTIMLRKEGCEHTQLMGWELEKDVWKALRADTVEISLPPEAILLLKE